MSGDSVSEKIVAMTLKVDFCIRRLSEVIVVTTAGVMLVTLAVNVLMRYLMDGGGISWFAELPSLLFPWMIAAGIILAVQQGAHIAIDLLRDMLPTAGKRVLAVLVNLLLVLSYGILFSALLDMIEIVSIERSALLNVSAAWPYSAMVFAAFCTALCCLMISLRIMLKDIDAAHAWKAEEAH